MQFDSICFITRVQSVYNYYFHQTLAIDYADCGNVNWHLIQYRIIFGKKTDTIQNTRAQHLLAKWETT